MNLKLLQLALPATALFDMYSGSVTPDPTAPQGEVSMVMVEAEPEYSVDGLIIRMIGLSAYLQRLYLQVHLLHFNYESCNFLAIHKFTKKQYEAHVDQFDKVCEYIRSMDYLVPDDGKELMGYCKSFRFNKSRDADEMLTVYAKNLEDLGMEAKEICKIAGIVEAPDIENYMAELCGMAFKAAWYCKASLRGKTMEQ